MTRILILFRRCGASLEHILPKRLRNDAACHFAFSPPLARRLAREKTDENISSSALRRPFRLARLAFQLPPVI